MPLDPSLPTVLNEWLNERLHELHTAMPGKFKSYDATKQTAEVIPLIKQSLLAADGSRTEFDLPVIPNVRVHWPRTSAGYIHFPITAGDFCLLVFNEAAIGFFRENGEVSSAGDLERFGLSHPYAIPGSWPDASPLASPPAGPAIIVTSHLQVSTPGGTVDFVALAEKTNQRLSALETAMNSHTHPYVDTPIGPSVTSATASPVTPGASVASSTLKVE